MSITGGFDSDPDALSDGLSRVSYLFSVGSIQVYNSSGQTGSFGPYASTASSTFMQSVSSGVIPEGFTAELSQLVAEMRRKAGSLEHYPSIESVAKAEIEAKKGNHTGVYACLKNAVAQVARETGMETFAMMISHLLVQLALGGAVG